MYFNDYYKADSNVKTFLESSEQVKVEKINNGYYFNGFGENTAMIFYPGAKVEAISYAPLLYELAKQGVDCFLIEMPYNFALFNQNAANKIIYDSNYDYENWYLSGHSLGGVVASRYVNNNASSITGLILLASYPTKELDSNIKLLSIYGNKDGVLNFDNYQESKKYYNSNSTEICIDGANHAQFGNYGKQDGDNVAEISSKEQQDKTIEAILNLEKN